MPIRSNTRVSNCHELQIQKVDAKRNHIYRAIMTSEAICKIVQYMT